MVGLSRGPGMRLELGGTSDHGKTPGKTPGLALIHVCTSIAVGLLAGFLYPPTIGHVHFGANNLW